VSAPSRRISERPARPEAAELQVAIDRATGTRAIAGNDIAHLPDSAAALDAMIHCIERARRSVHLENYIIRHDHTGRRFADALEDRCRAGVRVRVLYDALGSLGTSRRFWRRLTQAGVEVRRFNPLLTVRLSQVISRDHRKLLVVDGDCAILGGLCIGDEWAGDPERRRLPWRDTMLQVRGPAVAALQRAFNQTWSQVGAPLPEEEYTGDLEPTGTSHARIVHGVPGHARMYRAAQLLAGVATERLWITDAYLVAPPPLFSALIDAARGGVDVRLLVPGSSDLPVVRTATRAGYRELLHAGVRIFEWGGPMLHAKTLVADRRWARVGSSNLNASSLLTNFEIDVLAECDRLTQVLAAQFRHDLAHAREIVLKPRRYLKRPALVGAPATGELPPRAPHKRSGYERGTAAAVALGRVAGGLRRTLAGAAALVMLVAGALLLVFPRVMSVVLAAGAFWLALGFLVYGGQRRRAREAWEDEAKGR
jgi:cardiolipin synthase